MEKFLNKFHVGESVEIMKTIPDESVGLVVTSPPYNLRNSSGGGMKRPWDNARWSNAALGKGYETHDDNMPHDEYVKWQREVLSESMRVLQSDGAIFYNHKWRVQKGLIQDRSDIVEGFPVRQIIIWQRSGGINFNPGYFLPTYEVIYLIAKPDFKLAPKANTLGDVWNISQDRGNPHPAPFPVELADRIVSSTTAELVLDPFMGSGTTAVAAVKNGRDFIGIDASEEYTNLAEVRLENFRSSGATHLFERDNALF